MGLVLDLLLALFWWHWDGFGLLFGWKVN